MRSRTRTLIRWVPVVTWAAVIFAMSSVPGSRVPGNFSIQAHFTEYAILGALTCFAFHGRRGIRVAIVLAVIACSLYGISDEWHQSFVPLRTPDPADWAVDTAGALVGASAMGLWLRTRSSKPEARPQ